MGLGGIIINARKLNNIGRWANEFLHQRASVAEHSFLVTQLAQLLGFIEEKNGNTVNWKVLYRKALNHDLPEAVMGDVISTTKNINPDVKKTLEHVERELVEDELLASIEPHYRELYREAIFDGKDDSLEGMILSAADNIDALLECVLEVKLANRDPFLAKYYTILDKLLVIDIVSSKYFISDILPSLIGDCELLANGVKK